MSDPEFRRDLYRGTAQDYDRFRIPYPRRLIDDLAERTGADGGGRLLDLACGPGPISFALCDRFNDVLAVDAEPDMIGFAASKASAAGVSNIAFLTSAVEELAALDESFDLITIGNAFHRLKRAAVAASALRWLRPGGFLALLWSGSPWEGQAPWHRAISATMAQWRTRAPDGDRIPPGYEQDRRQRPDLEILGAAGFQYVGTYEFRTGHEWTPETLIGYFYSTAVLSRRALGGLAPEFEEDIRRALLASEPVGRLHQRIKFVYVLTRRGSPAAGPEPGPC
jgi:SAM-dependent methyltransferase